MCKCIYVCLCVLVCVHACLYSSSHECVHVRVGTYMVSDTFGQAWPKTFTRKAPEMNNLQVLAFTPSSVA